MGGSVSQEFRWRDPREQMGNVEAPGPHLTVRMAKQLLDSEPKPHLHCSAVLEQPRAAAMLRSVWRFPSRVSKVLITQNSHG